MSGCVEGRQHSAASRQLLAFLQQTTRTALALRLKVTRACVGHWASGRSKPEYTQRMRCKDELGIDPSFWDMPPEAEPRAAA